jgi:1-acyl-sn-glycerol-3-phosphate acyltransferase
MLPMLRLFSIVYWAFFVAMLLPLFAVALVVFALTAPFDRRRLPSHAWSCVWGTFYVVANPLWRLRVDGREKLPWRGPAVLVANHLSLLDILVLYGLFRPFKWVAKAELFKIPFVGWNMRLNDYVPVLRGDRESVRKMMAHCREHLARGTPILIFPEGTRSQDGHLQPFKDGAFRLALDAGVPVIPIAVTGTADALPKHGLVLRQWMSARVRVLDPIEPRDHPSLEALKEAARAAIIDALPEANRPRPRPDPAPPARADAR